MHGTMSLKFHFKNKFKKLVHLVGFIIRNVPAIIVILQWDMNFLNRLSTNTLIPNSMKILPVGTELSMRMEGTERQVDRRTEMTKLIFAFHNSANAPKNYEECWSGHDSKGGGVDSRINFVAHDHYFIRLTSLIALGHNSNLPSVVAGTF
jgi:hypothetical protein